MAAVEKNPKSFQNIGRNLKEDDDMFKIAIFNLQQSKIYHSIAH